MTIKNEALDEYLRVEERFNAGISSHFEDIFLGLWDDLLVKRQEILELNHKISLLESKEFSGEKSKEFTALMAKFKN